MSARCPEGHTSRSTDYCDTCGAPMSSPGPTAGGAPAPSVPAGPGSVPDTTGDASDSAADPAATQECPHCHTLNRTDDLFCEVCGFDFTTGVMPRPVGGEPSFLGLDVPTPAGPPQPDDPVDVTEPDPDPHADGPDDGDDADDVPADGTSDPVVEEIPIEDPPEPGADPAPPAPAPIEEALPDPEKDEEQPDEEADPPVDPLAVPPPPAEAPRPATDLPAAPADAGRASKPINRPPSREVAGDWVVEIWIDPDWYRLQDSGETCPSPAPPDIVRLTGSTALIGRRSASRGVTPDVDCGIDTGVSRRQAMLAGDGRRWWIEDLGSANGTYVGPAAGPLPTTALTPGRRVEVEADDRVYVGAWTRLVLRPATESEIAGHG